MKSLNLTQRKERSAAAIASPRQSGVTLIELMVAMAIGLVILAALVAVFVNTSRSNRELARTNSVIENGRLAVQVLENDIVHAGFWGTFVPQFDDQTEDAVPADVPNAVPDPCLAYDPVAGTWTAQYITNLVGIPAQSYEDTTALAGCPTGVLANYLAGTDLLVIRHANTCIAGGGSPNCEPDTAGRLYFQASRCDTDLVPYVLDTGGFTLTQRDCAAVAERRQFVSHIYYVRDFAVTAGDGIPTLMRAQFDLSGTTLAFQPAVPLIEGIEAFRVEFGIDDVSRTGAAVDYTEEVDWADPNLRTTPTNRGDGAPDGDFLRCTAATPCAAADLMNVTAVKLYVLARSREPSQGHTDTKTYDLGDTTLGPFNDEFKRHLFITTVRLPNVSGRRMTPPPAPPPPPPTP
jgi:type IV pilus assembly protein PilW